VISVTFRGQPYGMLEIRIRSDKAAPGVVKMAISRRVTARFHKRVRRGAVSNGSSGVLPDASNVKQLPVPEALSGLVAPCKQATRPKPATISRSIRLSTYLLDARARAEEILREHPHHDGCTGATCQACLAAYPCDAARAAQDVIAICEELHLGRLLSSKALLELMTELVDLGDLEKDDADPLAPGSDHGASVPTQH
jgi:hypothetical protein